MSGQDLIRIQQLALAKLSLRSFHLTPDSLVSTVPKRSSKTQISFPFRLPFLSRLPVIDDSTSTSMTVPTDALKR